MKKIKKFWNTYKTPILWGAGALATHWLLGATDIDEKTNYLCRYIPYLMFGHAAGSAAARSLDKDAPPMKRYFTYLGAAAAATGLWKGWEYVGSHVSQIAETLKQIPSAGVYGKTGFPGSSGPEAAEDFALTSGLLAAYRLPVLVKDVKSYVSKQISELK